MQYLTNSFYSKFRFEDGIGQPKLDTESCVKDLNKWLAKSNQQDVKVDDFNLNIEWEDDDLTKYRTRLVIIYHHVKFH